MMMYRKDGATKDKSTPALPQKDTNYYQAEVQRKEQVIGSMNLPFELVSFTSFYSLIFV